MNNTATWHQMIETRNVAMLEQLLADDAVFHSPVMHSPQAGKKLVQRYLTAAFSVLLNDSFRYSREVIDDTNSILEFELELSGVKVNGVDMIKWDSNGQIVEFKVMLRPLKGIQQVQQEMSAMLERLAAKQPA